MNSFSRTALLTVAFAVSLVVAPAPCLAQQTPEDAEAMAEMRALQSELRAIIRFEQAANVPLAD